MTKIEAIRQVMIECGGTATLNDIYQKIDKYYPSAKESNEWQAGLRGVLYREIRNGRMFKKIGLSIYALADYVEEKKPEAADKLRMHSFIEGVCIEIGNVLKNYHTYTADPSALYRDNIHLSQIASLQQVPRFTYEEVVNEVKRIDVIWFNKTGLLYPQKVFEVVDSIGTLDGAFDRSLQLERFKTEFYIVAPEKHREKFNKRISMRPYDAYSGQFQFINYDEIQEYYESVAKTTRLGSKIFGL